MLISQMIKGCKEKFFINQILTKISDVFIRGKKILQKKKMLNFISKIFFPLMKTSDNILVENLVNKKLLLAAFYHLTYQHDDSKDFNICNYRAQCTLLMYVFIHGGVNCLNSVPYRCYTYVFIHGGVNCLNSVSYITSTGVGSESLASATAFVAHLSCSSYMRRLARRMMGAFIRYCSVRLAQHWLLPCCSSVLNTDSLPPSNLCQQ